MSTTPDKPKLASEISASDSVGHELIAEFFATVVTALLGGVLGFTVFGGQFADLYMKVRPSVAATGEVAVVTIGPAALHAWDAEKDWVPAGGEQVPTPRALLAQLVRTLDEAGARVIALDVLLDSPAADDDLLREAARAHGTVIGGEMPQLNAPSTGGMFSRGVSPSLGGAIDAAHLALKMEEPVLFTGKLIVRGAAMSYCYQQSHLARDRPGAPAQSMIEPQLVPAFSLASAWAYRDLAVGGEASVSSLQTSLENACGWLQGNAGASCIHAAQDLTCTTADLGENLSLPVAPNRDLRLNYLGSQQNITLPVVDALDLIQVEAMSQRLHIPVPLPPDVAQAVSDKIVVVGRTDGAAEQWDRHATPYSFPWFRSQDMSGVFIQAQLMDALLSGRRLVQAPVWLTLLVTVLMLVLTLVLHRKLHAVQQAGVLLFTYVALVGIGTCAFWQTDGFVLELGMPLSASVLLCVALHFWDMIKENV